MINYQDLVQFLRQFAGKIVDDLVESSEQTSSIVCLQNQRPPNSPSNH